KDDVKVLKLTSENINLYVDFYNKCMDFDKVKSCEMLYFTKNLIKNVKSLESYYIESVQVLNFDSIYYEEFCLNKEYIKSDKFRKKVSQVLNCVNDLILKKFLVEKR
uniref:hypothetical protein n=1 Tax=Clostridioides difficile TaxID=1496 RepID=UPI0013EFA545